MSRRLSQPDERRRIPGQLRSFYHYYRNLLNVMLTLWSVKDSHWSGQTGCFTLPVRPNQLHRRKPMQQADTTDSTPLDRAIDEAFNYQREIKAVRKLSGSIFPDDGSALAKRVSRIRRTLARSPAKTVTNYGIRLRRFMV